MRHRSGRLYADAESGRADQMTVARYEDRRQCFCQRDVDCVVGAHVITELPDTIQERLVRVSFKIDRTPLGQRKRSVRAAQQPSVGVAAKYVHDLQIDEVGYVNAHGGILHPCCDPFTSVRIQQELNRA